MYKIPFGIDNGQHGVVYVSANSQELAIAKVKKYFKKYGRIELGLVSFQFEDMFIEMESDRTP